MRLRFQLILFTITRMVMNIGTRMVYPFLAVFARGLGMELGAISLALTVRASTGFISPFISSMADRRGRKTGMILGLGIYVLSCALVMLFPVYPVFFASLSLCFVGMYTYMSAVQAYLGDRVPYQQRGMAMGLTETGWSLSFIIGMPVVAFLIGRFGWQAPFPVLAGLGLLLLGLLYRLIPSDRPENGSAAGQQPFWHSIGQVVHSPLALTGLAMSFSTTVANEMINLVFGVWMEDSFGLKIAALGAAAAVIGFAELGGELLSSNAADKLGKPRVVVAGLVLNALVTLFFPLLGRTLAGAMVGLFIFYFSFEVAIVSQFTLMSEVMPGARATLMGANVAVISLGRMLGALLGPLLYTWGFQLNAFAALAFNLLALLALSRLHLQPQPLEEKLEM